MLQGILASCRSSPDGEHMDLEDFKKLFNDEDWKAMECNLINLDHLSKVFPPPLHNGDPPLICSHCLHRTNPDTQLSWLDYQETLMATDHSHLAVMNHLKNHLLVDIGRDLEIWLLDEMNKGRNELHPQLQEDKQLHYTRCVKEIT
jgi:hypothetical protein